MNSKDYQYIAKTLKSQYSIAKMLGRQEAMDTLVNVKVSLGLKYRKDNRSFSYKKWTQDCGF